MMIFVGLNLDPRVPPVGGDTLDDEVADDMMEDGEGGVVGRDLVDAELWVMDCDRGSRRYLRGLVEQGVVRRQRGQACDACMCVECRDAGDDGCLDGCECGWKQVQWWRFGWLARKLGGGKAREALSPWCRSELGHYYWRVCIYCSR